MFFHDNPLNIFRPFQISGCLLNTGNYAKSQVFPKVALEKLLWLTSDRTTKQPFFQLCCLKGFRGFYLINRLGFGAILKFLHDQVWTFISYRVSEKSLKPTGYGSVTKAFFRVTRVFKLKTLSF